MKRIHARLLCLALALVMVLASGVAIAEGQTYEEFMQPYDETVRISTARVFATWMTLDPGDDENNNFYTRAYKDHLNIELYCDWTAPGWGADLDQKFNTSLAADDLPDVFKVYTSLAAKAIANDKVMNITPEMYDNWLSDYVKGIYASDPIALKAWTVDGQLKGLPGNVSEYPERKYWWVRTAWLDELGLDMPTNTAEVIEVARKFVEAKPEGSDPNLYGIALDQKLTALTDMFPVFGVSRANWYETEEGELSYRLIQPGVKDAIQFFADLYAEGLIAKDFALKTDDNEVTQDRINGKFGVWLEGTNFVATPKFTNWYEMNPEKNDCDFTVMTDFEGNMPMIIQSTSYGDAWFISSKCENPDAVFKIFNLDADIVSENNKPDWIVDREYDVSATGGFNFWHRLSGIEDKKAKDPYRVANAFAAKDRDSLATLDDLVTYDEMLAWETDGMNNENWSTNIYRYRLNILEGPIIDQYNYNIAGQDYIYSPFWGNDTESMMANGANWVAKFTEMATNAIIENNVDEAFQSFVDFFYANGGEQAIKEANEWYAEHRDDA